MNGEVPSDPGPDPILALAILDTVIDPADAALALVGYVVGRECCYFSDETCSSSWNGEVPSDPCPDPILALTVLDTVVDPAAPAATTARDSDSSHYSPPLLHASLTWTNSSFQATHSQ